MLRRPSPRKARPPKRRGQLPSQRPIGAGIDPDIERAVEVYLGRHGVAYGHWRSRAEVRAALEMGLGYLVAEDDVVRVLRAKVDAGEAEHRKVLLADVLERHEWRFVR